MRKQEPWTPALRWRTRQGRWGNPIVAIYSVSNGIGILGSALGPSMDWYFFIQLWNCHRRLWIVRQVDGIKVHWGCWTQRCRYGLFGVLWKSMSYRLQGVGEIYWRKNHSVSDSFSVVSPWVYVPDNCWRREWMGFFFFDRIWLFVQPLEVLLKSLLYGCVNWGVQLNCWYSSWWEFATWSWNSFELLDDLYCHLKKPPNMLNIIVIFYY